MSHHRKKWSDRTETCTSCIAETQKKSSNFRTTVSVWLFQTSDATVQNGVTIYEQIIMSGFPHTLSAEELQEALPDKLKALIEDVRST